MPPAARCEHRHTDFVHSAQVGVHDPVGTMTFAGSRPALQHAAERDLDRQELAVCRDATVTDDEPAVGELHDRMQEVNAFVRTIQRDARRR